MRRTQKDLHTLGKAIRVKDRNPYKIKMKCEHKHTDPPLPTEERMERLDEHGWIKDTWRHDKGEEFEEVYAYLTPGGMRIYDYYNTLKEEGRIEEYLEERSLPELVEEAMSTEYIDDPHTIEKK